MALTPDRRQLLVRGEIESRGDPAWRARKHAEARDLLGLSQIAANDRLRVVDLDLTEELRALVEMDVTVPCLPDRDGPLVVARRAVLSLTWPCRALDVSLPGFDFVQIVAPTAVWHPNVEVEPAQRLCLGDRLPVGVGVREILQMSYGALTFSTIELDPAGAAGVLNEAAAHWWRANARLVPLSRQPFLGAGRGHPPAPTPFRARS